MCGKAAQQITDLRVAPDRRAAYIAQRFTLKELRGRERRRWRFHKSGCGYALERDAQNDGNRDEFFHNQADLSIV